MVNSEGSVQVGQVIHAAGSTWLQIYFIAMFRLFIDRDWAALHAPEHVD